MPGYVCMYEYVVGKHLHANKYYVAVYLSYNTKTSGMPIDLPAYMQAHTYIHT